jgi:hypothetical protein
MSIIVKKQVVINRIKLPHDVLSVVKDYIFNDIAKYMLKIKKKKNIVLTEINNTTYSGKNIINDNELDFNRSWHFWVENDENCPQFQAYFCTKCGNYEYLSSLTYDGILKIMCDCE